jgi:hypothetical protein
LDSQPSSRTGENSPYGMIGGIEETSASFEARSAPRSYPTRADFLVQMHLRAFCVINGAAVVDFPASSGLSKHEPKPIHSAFGKLVIAMRRKKFPFWNFRALVSDSLFLYAKFAGAVVTKTRRLNLSLD